MSESSYEASFARLRGGTRGAGGSARGIAGREGLLFVQGNTAGINAYLRTIEGRFAPAGASQAVGINYRLARELGELVVQELDARVRADGRPAVRTGRLAKAIMDPKNLYVDPRGFGFGVGNPSFLNASDAKYWRAIEQGTNYFVGRQIRGVWGPALGGGQGRGVYGPYAIPRGPYSGFGEGTGQKLYPLGTTAARLLLQYEGATRSGGAKKLPKVKGIIRQPIQEYRYFKRGWERFDMRSRADAVIKNIYPMAQRRAPRGKR